MGWFVFVSFACIEYAVVVQKPRIVRLDARLQANVEPIGNRPLLAAMRATALE